MILKRENSEIRKIFELEKKNRVKNTNYRRIQKLRKKNKLNESIQCVQDGGEAVVPARSWVRLLSCA